MQSKDEGALTARIVLVGEAYGRNEMDMGRPFVGASYTDKLLPWWRDCEPQITREQCYITNAWDQGMPERIDGIPESDMRAAMERCRQRVDKIVGPDGDGRGPYVIVCTGNYALYTFTGNGRVSFHARDGRHERPGIKDWRGSVFVYRTNDGREIKVIGTIHPAATFSWGREPSLEWVCRADWRRIAKDAYIREPLLPSYTKMIGPSEGEVRHWLEWTQGEAEKTKSKGRFVERMACSLDVETPKKVNYTLVEEATKSTALTVKCKGCGHTRRWHALVLETVSDADGMPVDSASDGACAGLRGKGGCSCLAFDAPMKRPRRKKDSEEAYLGCIGYCWRLDHALCVPTTLDYWQDPAVLARVMAMLRAFHADPNIDFGGQNFGFDAWWCAKENIPLWSLAWDLMKMHRVQRPWSEWHDLAFQASLDTRHPFWKHESKLPDEISRWSHNKEQLWAYNCLAVESEVLMADFTTSPLGALQVGDQVLAPDENGGAQRHGEVSRRWRVTTVTKTATDERSCWRVKMASGRELVLTPEHRVLVDKNSGGKRWIEAADLKIGSRVVCGLRNTRKLCGTSHGWLGGFLDGEGTLLGITMKEEQRGRAGLGAISYAQKPGIVLNYADEIMVELFNDIEIAGEKKHPIGYDGSALQTYVRGGTQTAMALLAAIPTLRLRAAMRRLIEVGDIHATGLYDEEVVSVEPAGIRAVADITTTTGTFVANGFVVHNCTDNVVQRELLDVRLQALASRGRLGYYMQMESPIDDELLPMSLHGMRADIPGRQAEHERLTEQAKTVALELNAAAEMPIVGVSKKGVLTGKQPSNAKLKVFLYEKLRLPVQMRKNAKGQKTASTDIVAIKRLMESFPGLTQLQSVGTLVLRHRRLTKKATDLKDSRVEADGRVYAIFKQDTLLGRLSSSATPMKQGQNLQNVDHELRKFYLADSGAERPH